MIYLRIIFKCFIISVCIAKIFYLESCLQLWNYCGIIIPQYIGGATMATIIPIKDLKNTSEISDLCHKTDSPVYITKNGYGDMVIMSIETYENLFERLRMYHSLLTSEQQIKEGHTTDAKESLSKTREKYAL